MHIKDQRKIYAPADTVKEEMTKQKQAKVLKNKQQEKESKCSSRSKQR